MLGKFHDKTEARTSCFEKNGHEIAIHGGKTVNAPAQKQDLAEKLTIPNVALVVAKSPELDNATKKSSVIISIPIDVMFGEAATNHGNFKIKKHGTTPQLLVTATTPNNQTSIFGIL